MAQAIAALTFLALACATVAASLRLRMFTAEGPGAGLFPLIIGIGLALCAAIWLVQIRRGPRRAVLEGIDRAGAMRILAQIAALVGFTLALAPLGYIASSCGLILATALIAGERSWPWIAVVAAIGSIGLQRLFDLLGTTI